MKALKIELFAINKIIQEMLNYKISKNLNTKRQIPGS